jgi:hypothetical protein
MGMTGRTTGDATAAASTSYPPAPGAGIPPINPRTGLSTDYLNHFTEAVMVLEMITTMPECVDDLKAWQPKSYCEHFAASRLSNRETVIAAYHRADPAVREALDRAAETLNVVLAKTRNVVVSHRTTPEAEALARRAASWLKPLIARMAAVIDGGSTPGSGRHDCQAAIDAMLAQ